MQVVREGSIDSFFDTPSHTVFPRARDALSHVAFTFLEKYGVDKGQVSSDAGVFASFFLQTSLFQRFALINRDSSSQGEPTPLLEERRYSQVFRNVVDRHVSFPSPVGRKPMTGAAKKGGTPSREVTGARRSASGSSATTPRSTACLFPPLGFSLRCAYEALCYVLLADVSL